MSDEAGSDSGVQKWRCEECGDEIVTEPGWNDRHVHIEIRFTGGAGMRKAYLCDEDCARDWIGSVDTGGDR